MYTFIPLAPREEKRRKRPFWHGFYAFIPLAPRERKLRPSGIGEQQVSLSFPSPHARGNRIVAFCSFQTTCIFHSPRLTREETWSALAQCPAAAFIPLASRERKLPTQTAMN